jgi:hypothetical protein
VKLVLINSEILDVFPIPEVLVEVGWGDVDLIGLAQDRERWRALILIQY